MLTFVNYIHENDNFCVLNIIFDDPKYGILTRQCEIYTYNTKNVMNNNTLKIDNKTLYCVNIMINGIVTTHIKNICVVTIPFKTTTMSSHTKLSNIL
jgi:hypothetical protein